MITPESVAEAFADLERLAELLERLRVATRLEVHDADVVHDAPDEDAVAGSVRLGLRAQQELHRGELVAHADVASGEAEERTSGERLIRVRPVERLLVVAIGLVHVACVVGEHAERFERLDRDLLAPRSILGGLDRGFEVHPRHRALAGRHVESAEREQRAGFDLGVFDLLRDVERQLQVTGRALRVSEQGPDLAALQAEERFAERARLRIDAGVLRVADPADPPIPDLGRALEELLAAQQISCPARVSRGVRKRPPYAQCSASARRWGSR
jgi:hypothetical protein